MKRNVTLVILIATALIAGGCRSRVKPATTPTAGAEVPTQRVEAPAQDFARSAPEPARDPLEGADVNRVARERGWIRDAFFEFDSTTLDPSARSALDTSARWLRENPQFRLVIEGHCDERGTEQYNLALGERRAAAAREYLTILGIDPRRVTHVSFGEERPFAEGSNEEAWQQNRRAHLTVER